MDCPPPRKRKLGQYNVAYFQYHIKRLENEVVTLTQTVSAHELKAQYMQNQMKNVQRKLKGRDLQLEQYKKRIAKLQVTNQEFKQQLQKQKEMLNNKLKKEKQINETKISELNKVIINFKQQLKSQSQTIKSQNEIILRQKKMLNCVNDNDDKSEDDNGISIGQYDSSISESLTPNTQDKLFNATPDEIDKIMLADDCDYNPMNDVDESMSSDD